MRCEKHSSHALSRTDDNPEAAKYPTAGIPDAPPLPYTGLGHSSLNWPRIIPLSYFSFKRNYAITQPDRRRGGGFRELPVCWNCVPPLC